MLKPDKYFGEGAARGFEYAMQTGVSLNSTAPFVTRTVLRCTRVHPKSDVKITFSRDTVKVLAVGINGFDEGNCRGTFPARRGR